VTAKEVGGDVNQTLPESSSLDLEARSLAHQAWEAQQKGDSAMAEELWRQSLALRTGIVGGDKDVVNQLAVADTCSALADLMAASQRAKEAEAFLKQAAALVAPLAANGERLDALDAHGTVLTDLGDLMLESDRLRQAEGYYRQALAARRLLATKAGGMDAQRKLAQSFTNLADLLLDKEVFREAEGFYRRALEITLVIQKQDNSHEVQTDLVFLYNGLGDSLDEIGSPEEAGECWEASLSIATGLTKRPDADEESWHLLCQCLYRMTYLHAELQDDLSVADLLGRWSAALAMLSKERRGDFEEEYTRLTKALGKKSR